MKKRSKKKVKLRAPNAHLGEKHTIILVRHGQYQKEPEELTSLGREQARLVAKRLREWDIDQIVYSNMPRAKETAEIIEMEIDFRGKMLESPLLRECLPGFMKEYRAAEGFNDLKRLRKDKATAEKAFAKFFGFKGKKKTVVLVCHGNIIRFFMMKILKANSDNWMLMDIQQCGISVVRSDKKKFWRMISHNDIGHIPAKLRTFI